VDVAAAVAVVGAALRVAVATEEHLAALRGAVF